MVDPISKLIYSPGSGGAKLLLLKIARLCVNFIIGYFLVANLNILENSMGLAVIGLK